MSNRIAASIAPRDTATCLALLHALGPQVGAAEVRLDQMESFDLPRLVAAAPCPLVITYRPTREGGAFDGPEEQRLAVLAQAIDLGCAYVDVEWDCAAALARHPRRATRLIVSRHWFDRMPAETWAAYQELHAHADVVKLVGAARQPSEMLPIFELLRDAPGQVIAIAMGAAGQLTRLLAPCFDSCLLTYAAATPADITAAGQFSVGELADVYRLQEVGPHTRIHLHLCADAESAAAVAARNAGVTGGAHLHAPLVIAPAQAAALVPGLRSALPRLELTADPELAGALRERATGR